MATQKEKKSLSNGVYDYLKTKILNNELLPGDKLIEMEIAKELEVSRTPVREALAKLSKDGLAENFPRKSYIVSKISMKDARDLYSVRTALEPMAVREIAEEGITNRTVILENIISKMTRAYENGDLETVKEQIIEWNISLINLTQNPILKDTLNIVNEKLYRFANFIFRDEKNVKDVYTEINAIFSAIKNLDGEGAYNISYKYVSGIYPMLETQSDYKMFRF
ncbi:MULTISPECIES: GntR family transcriptional regulator [Peptoniphilus]|uniref:GntR family transcriptional regulator n=1 Tax=Peptoniphilus TaxID=162289 RepID=UPI00031D846B|nr:MULTISPECIES: GntR family transcriptional regulator [Peptoniphilus]